MARTAVTVTQLAGNAGIDEPAGTALDVANGHSIDVAGKSGKLLIQVKNTNGSPRVVTVKAGASNPPAFRKALGDLAVTAPANANSIIGPLEAARFIQADGKVYVDLAASITGTIVAYLMPLHVVDS